MLTFNNVILSMVHLCHFDDLAPICVHISVAWMVARCHPMTAVDGDICVNKESTKLHTNIDLL